MTRVGLFNHVHTKAADGVRGEFQLIVGKFHKDDIISFFDDENLLIAQGDNGIQAGGSQCGIDAEANPRAD